MVMVLILAIILFLLAAGFGLVNLTSILQDKPTSKVFVYSHGTLAFLGVLLVIYYVATHLSHAPWTSLILFLVAAIGGLIMFVIDLKKKSVPKWLALLHPVIALIALFALVIFLITPQGI